MKRHKGKSLLHVKNIVLVLSEAVVILLALVLVYSLIDRSLIHPAVRSNRADEDSPTKIEKLIQVSVRNECGADNIALHFTFYLRKRGFDVVETINGSTPDRKTTTVVDGRQSTECTESRRSARVTKENVVTSVDPRSYVDVEVLIGEDYQKLKPNGINR